MKAVSLILLAMLLSACDDSSCSKDESQKAAAAYQACIASHSEFNLGGMCGDEAYELFCNGSQKP